MKRMGLLIGFLAVVVFLLPLTAQDAEKKGEKKEPDKKKEKLVYGTKFYAKIVKMKGESNREYKIEIQELDQKKVYEFNVWKSQRSTALAQQQINAAKLTFADQRARALEMYRLALFDFNAELAKRSSNLTISRTVDVRAAENAKVRSMIPPIEFDDQGFQKKWTKKEFDALRAKSPLLVYYGDKYKGLAAGIATDFDAVKAGQHVDIYMAYVPPKKKDDPKKKKSPDDEDPPAAKDRPLEFVLVVILPDGKK
jgi:hypothetical protein